MTSSRCSFSVFVFKGSLVDKKGKILVPGIHDGVAPLTKEEEELYGAIEFDLEEYSKDVGVRKLLHKTKVRTDLQLKL